MLNSVFGLCVCWLLWHLLYDWHWQDDFVAKWKAKSNFILFIHSLTWSTGLILISLPFTHLFHVKNMALAIIFSWVYLEWTHYTIDKWKCGYETKPENAWTLPVDQFMHLVTMAFTLACLLWKV